MAKSKYFPKEIEQKWQKAWRESGIYKFQIANGIEHSAKSSSLSSTPKALGNFYTLVELPYPSGDLHIGHWFAFVAPDVLSRFKRMQGYNVFFPMGYDAFGLPAENAAIKRGIHPKDWTLKNIETMTAQFETMGTMIDWDHVTVTCLPEYYTWNQWIFLKMYEKGIAYRGKTLSNWCPTDQTVLANEHVENGKCWRCGDTVVQKEVEQWFLKITDYAERLLWPEQSAKSIAHSAKSGDNSSKLLALGSKPAKLDWPKSVQVAQNDWIGKSEGMEIDFKVAKTDKTLTVFTTRPETIDGATFIVIAPEHDFIREVRFENEHNIMRYVQESLLKQEQDRLVDAKTKTGVDTGYKAINPITGKEIPVYIADYVLGNYGTGAIMGVPFADKRDSEFAKAHKLAIIETTFQAKPEGKKITFYHLRDWSVSRQRYWGTPVPMIHCDTDGIIPVPLDQLPITLPYDVDYQPKGKAPLASNEQWMKVACPKCGKEARRDPETLDTFFDSAWYYYRYIDPSFKEGPFDKKLVSQLMPLDIYFGGGEHTLGHTLYARFFTKFFKDLGMVAFDEFAKKRVQHGIVLGPDGNKMSKSKGNVINPDDVVKEFGTDAVRIYLSFMMPYEATGPWSTSAMYGMFRFLKRVWDLQDKIDESFEPSKEDLFHMHTAIKNVTTDLEEVKNNTAIAEMMKWINYLEPKEKISLEEFKTFLIILSPFAPHITEELWQLQRLTDSEAKDVTFSSVHQQKWPSHDDNLIVSDTVTIAVQVNGKLRDTIEIENSKVKNQNEVEAKVRASAKVKTYLGGKSVKKVIYVPGKILNFVVA